MSDDIVDKIKHFNKVWKFQKFISPKDPKRVKFVEKVKKTIEGQEKLACRWLNSDLRRQMGYDRNGNSVTFYTFTFGPKMEQAEKILNLARGFSRVLGDDGQMVIQEIDDMYDLMLEIAEPYKESKFFKGRQHRKYLAVIRGVDEMLGKMKERLDVIVGMVENRK